MNETTQFMTFIQRQNICWDNFSAWIIGVNMQSHFSSSLSSRHTLLPQIIPSIVKMEYLQAFIWVYSLQVSQDAIRITFSFSCFETRLSFLPIWSWKTPGISLTFIIGYQCYDRCTPFLVIFTLIDHPCFNFEENIFVNFNLSYLSPTRNMAHTLLP